MGLLAIQLKKGFILAYDDLVDDLRRVGLEVNHSKCELLILNHTREDSLRTEVMFHKIMPGLKVFRGRRHPTGSTCGVWGSPTFYLGLQGNCI